MTKDIVPNDPNKDSDMWRASCPEYPRLGTFLPSGLFKDILSKRFSVIEIKVLLVIVRMSFGFHGREPTNALALKDFAKETGCQTTHLSTAIKKLKKKGMIFRRGKNGNKYLYSINLLRYGLPMVHYRICNGRNEKSKEEYVWGSASYMFGNSEESKNYITVYSRKGYKKSKSLYKKMDIQSDIQTDKKTQMQKFALADRVISPIPQSRDNKKKDTPLNIPKNPPDNIKANNDQTLIYTVMRNGTIATIRQDGKKLLDAFREKIKILLSKKDYHAIEKTVTRGIQNQKQAGRDPVWILRIFETEFVAPYDNPGYVDANLMPIFLNLGGRYTKVEDIENHRYNLEHKKFVPIR